MTSAARQILNDFIIPSGFDVTATNKAGVSVLHLAAHYGFGDVVSMAIKAGCDVNAMADDSYKTRWKTFTGGLGPKPIFPRDCDLYKTDGFCIGSDISPLYLAARAGHVEIIRKLATSGADMNAGKRFGPYSGITALQAAAARGRVKAVEALLDCGCDVNARASDGGTALLCAVEFGHEEVVQVILDSTRDRERIVDMSVTKCCEDIGTLSALHLAVLTKSERILLQLIRAGAFVNQGNTHGFTPLHMAAQTNAVELAQILIDAGSDVNAKTDSGDCHGLTALHIAVRSGSPDLLRMLIDAGADWRATMSVADAENVGLLHLAAVCGEASVARMLIEVGCDLNAKTSAGATPLFLAVKEGHVDAAEEFLAATKGPPQLPTSSESKVGYMHIAVMHRSVRLARGLCAAGCDVDEVVSPDKDTLVSAELSSRRRLTAITPLLLAVDANEAEMTRTLLELGCDVNKVLPDCLTALHVAAFHGLAGIATILLAGGAKVNQLAAFEELSEATPLHLAVRYRNWEVAERLVRSGAKLNAVALCATVGPTNPLHLAVGNLDTETVRCLVNAGCDVNWSRVNGWTALRQASESGATEIVRILLGFGAVVKQQDVLALHLAAQRGHTDVVELMVKSGWDVNAAKPKDEAGTTALHLAAEEGNDDTLRKLVELGCDVNAQKSNGWTALHSVVRRNQVSVASTLLDAGAHANASANFDDRKSCRPLHLAAEHGYADMTRLLLKASADVHAASDQGTKRGLCAIHLAAMIGHQPTVRILVENGAKADGAADSDGFTALHFAAQKGHLDVVRSLTSVRRCRSVIAPACTPTGMTNVLPVHLAAEAGHAVVIRFLVAAGSPVDPDITLYEVSGITPLHMAAQNSHLQVVETLLKLGADVDRQDGRGYTALHRAVQNIGAASTVECLLRAGADPKRAADTGDVRGLLPLHTAAQLGNRAALKCLLGQKDCDVNVELSVGEVRGITALHLAVAQGHSDVVRALVKAGGDRARRTSEGKDACDIAQEKGFRKLFKYIKLTET